MAFPRNEKMLWAWLRDTSTGQAIMEKITRAACLACERVRDFETRCLTCEHRRKVLMVCGWSQTEFATIDVYADRAVDVHCAQQLCTDFAEADLLAEHYLESGLPHVYRELYAPGNLRGGATWRKRTADDEIERTINLGIMKLAQKLPEYIRPSMARLS